jgi:high-affinity iron transporter
MAVFREAFETVLFLRAVWLEGGDATKTAMATGLGGSLLFLLAASWLLVNVSAKLPLRKVFSASSILMIALSVILAGKGAHSLQETGVLGVTAALGHLRFETIGVYPTLQTLVAQAVVLAASISLWMIGKRPPAKITHAPVEDALAKNTETPA